jgi:hypothetical protein
MNAISTACPQIQEDALNCVPNGTNIEPETCFCPKLMNSSCPDVCQEGQGAAGYLHWALALCSSYTTTDNGETTSFVQGWKDYAQLEHVAYLNLFPWPWAIQYDPAADHRPPPAPGRPPLLPNCPSESGKLLSFAAINLSVFAITLLLGRRTFIHKLTLGVMGKPKGSGTWVLTALFFLALSIASNFLNALLIRSSPGFGGASIPDLMLLWCSRPRIAWAAALLVFVGHQEGQYFAAGASALVSEMVLQVLGAVYLAHTVGFAAVRGFYRVGRGDVEVEGWRYALMMYVGALLWIVPVGSALFQIVYSFLGLRELIHRVFRTVGKKSRKATRKQREKVALAVRRWAGERFQTWMEKSQKTLMDRAYFLNRLRAPEGSTEHQLAVIPRRNNTPRTSDVVGYDYLRALEAMGLSEESLRSMRTVVLLMILPYVGQWLFWAGFIRLAGDQSVEPLDKLLSTYTNRVVTARRIRDISQVFG